MSEGKVSPGQEFNPPPAAIWNNMVDAGRAWADDRFNNPASAPTRPRETDIIKVKNDSGAARRKGEILKIDGKAIETVADEQIWLLGKATTADCYFGILKRPVEIAGVESLQVSGVCIALVDITDVDHTRADVVAGEYVLASSDSGPLEILYQPGDTGEQECVVRFAGGSGGVIVIRFEIVDPVFCEACTASARVLSRPVGMASVPGEYGGIVTIADRVGCFLNEPNASLRGRRGYASYLSTEFDGPCPGMPNPSFEITSMCCAEEQCDG